MSHNVEKNPKGDPLGTSGFVGFLEKVKNESAKQRTLWTEFALALGGFRIVSRKWTDLCENCSLKKDKTGTSKVGAISKAQKAQFLKL